jgi:hypothetical protein
MLFTSWIMLFTSWSMRCGCATAGASARSSGTAPCPQPDIRSALSYWLGRVRPPHAHLQSMRVRLRAVGAAR